jgi:hypothetical protein
VVQLDHLDLTVRGLPLTEGARQFHIGRLAAERRYHGRTSTRPVEITTSDMGMAARAREERSCLAVGKHQSPKPSQASAGLSLSG